MVEYSGLRYNRIELYLIILYVSIVVIEVTVIVRSIEIFMFDSSVHGFLAVAQFNVRSTSHI